MLNFNAWTSKRNKLLVDPLKPDLGLIPELGQVEIERIVELLQKECGKKVDVEGSDLHVLRISVEYIAMVLDEDVIGLKELRRRTLSGRQDVLNWQDSLLGRMTISWGEKMTDEFKRLNYTSVLKTLRNSSEKGETKAAIALLETMGKSEGEPEKSMVPVEWTKEYTNPIVDGIEIPIPGKNV